GVARRVGGAGGDRDGRTVGAAVGEADGLRRNAREPVRGANREADGVVVPAVVVGRPVRGQRDGRGRQVDVDAADAGGGAVAGRVVDRDGVRLVGAVTEGVAGRVGLCQAAAAGVRAGEGDRRRAGRKVVPAGGRGRPVQARAQR